jgi:hypothetical protein
MIRLVYGNQTRAGAGLKSAGSGRARALHCGLRLLRARPGLGGRLGVWPVGLAQKPGPCVLRPGPAPALNQTLLSVNCWCSAQTVWILEFSPLTRALLHLVSWTQTQRQRNYGRTKYFKMYNGNAATWHWPMPDSNWKCSTNAYIQAPRTAGWN